MAGDNEPSTNIDGKVTASSAILTGKLADSLLLDASPLVDIANTTKINAVILNGRLLTGAGSGRNPGKGRSGGK